VATPKRKTLAKAMPDNPEHSALIKQLDVGRERNAVREEAKAIAATKATGREPVPAEYGKHNSTLPVIPADEVQTALHYLRGQGVSNPAVVVSWALLHIPEVCRECVRAYRVDGSVRPERFEPLLKAWREMHP
jgi:hypothetical protein